MRPPCVYANASAAEHERLRALLRGRGRTVVRAVMVLLSLHGLSPAQIAVLVEYDPATVRRWIGRFNACGAAG
ncbi:helix-turn-helix domain-containing protein, partial [Streptomyces chrestomyceticus]